MDRVKRSGKASPLFVATGPKDKENLGNPGVLLKAKSTPGSLKKKGSLKFTNKFTNKNIEMLKNQINNIQSDHATTRKPITAEDLTSNGHPGDGYWEQLSESRRVALESTWKENVELNSKIMELEYENTKLKAMLAEAKSSIQILTELLEENESDCEDESELEEAPLAGGGEAADTSTDADPDDSLVDASFTSL